MESEVTLAFPELAGTHCKFNQQQPRCPSMIWGLGGVSHLYAMTKEDNCPYLVDYASPLVQ
jgi:hypothetical protein